MPVKSVCIPPGLILVQYALHSHSLNFSRLNVAQKSRQKSSTVIDANVHNSTPEEAVKCGSTVVFYRLAALYTAEMSCSPYPLAFAFLNSSLTAEPT